MSNSYVLVINSGSSSLKFAVIDSKNGEALVTGLGECFGLPEAVLGWKYQGEKTEEAITAPDNHHQHAINRIVGLMESLGFTKDLVAVGQCLKKFENVRRVFLLSPFIFALLFFAYFLHVRLLHNFNFISSVFF